MRNIRIAPQEDRVSATRPAGVVAAPARRRRLRDWAATLPILVLVPALALPFVGAQAAGPRITLAPSAATPGAVVRVDGRGFPDRATGVVTLDGSTVSVAFTARRNGSFRAQVLVPAGAAAGAYQVVAVARTGTRASATLTVAASDPAPLAPPPPSAAPEAPLPAVTPPPAAVPPASAPATTAPSTTAPATAPTAAPASAAPVPTAAPTVPPAPQAPPQPAPATGAVLITASQIAQLPTSGSAWNGLKARADASASSPNLANQDDNTDLTVLAKGLVYARTGTTSYRTSALAAIKAAVGTEVGGRTLALGRNLAGYVIAADLISLRTVDPAYDQNVFRPWLRSLLTKSLDGRTLRSTHEDRPNNWGTHAGGARVAVAAYLGDSAELARVATVFRGWLGDRSAYAGFKYGELDWQCDPAKPVGINPVGCSRNGIALDGALPEEMRRGGTLVWPPTATDYAWEGLQGAMLQAEILSRHGYDAWDWSNRALLRAVKFLYDRAGWPAVGDDGWQTWLVDARYGTSYRGSAPARTGKNFGYTDWLYPS